MCACWLMSIDTYLNVYRHIFILFPPLYSKQDTPANKTRVNRPVPLLADLYRHMCKFVYKCVYKYDNIDIYKYDVYRYIYKYDYNDVLLLADVYRHIYKYDNIDTYTNMVI